MVQKAKHGQSGQTGMVGQDPQVAGIPASTRKGFIFDYLFSHLGYFTVMPLLAVWLPDLYGTWWSGVAMVAFGISVRAAVLIFGNALNRLPYAASMIGGLLLAGLGFCSLALPLPPIVGVIGLLLAGCGINGNGSAVRLYVADNARGFEEKSSLFAAINVAVNVAAGVGPFIGNFLFEVDPAGVFLTAGCAYFLAAVVPALTVRGRPVPVDKAADQGSSLIGVWLKALKSQSVAVVALAVFTGYLLYGQLFSSISQVVQAEISSEALRGSIFALNAVTVIVLQPVATKLSAALGRRGMAPATQLVVAPVVFICALLLLSVNPFVAIVVFSFAETLFIPLVDATILSLDVFSSVRAVKFRQATVALGEGLGMGLGVIFNVTTIAAIGAVALLACLVLKKFTVAETKEPTHV